MATFQFLDTADIEMEGAITRRLKSCEKHEKAQAIVRDGYVHLVGKVGSRESKDEIEGWVEALPGVRNVTNHIRVENWEEWREASHF